MRLIMILTLATCLVACSSSNVKHEKKSTPGRYAQEHDSAPEKPVDVNHVPDAEPKAEPKSRYGNMDSYEVFGKTYYTKDSSEGYVAHGKASWYGTKFHGARTSSGETYDMYEMTAAHTTLPLPTYARVTNTANGKSVIVKINDRGPFHEDRIIDLSYAAASRIGILNQGIGHVKVEALDPTTKQAPAPIPTMVAAQQQKTVDPSDKYYLQVAAFGEKTYAEKMLKQLETIIEQPMQISQNDSDHFYRVQVGPFQDETSANAYKAQLSGLIPEKPVLVTAP